MTGKGTTKMARNQKVVLQLPDGSIEKTVTRNVTITSDDGEVRNGETIIDGQTYKVQRVGRATRWYTTLDNWH